MFAVPGWSVPADALKTQRSSTDNENLISTRQKDRGSAAENKKRKRNRSEKKVLTVTSENVADLWRKHIEGKSATSVHEGDSAKIKDRRKRKRKNNEDENGAKIIDEIRDRTLVSTKPRFEDDAEDTSLKDLSEKTRDHDSKSKRRTTESKAEGKAKYEQRKAQSSKKRKKKAELLGTSDITSPSHLAPSPERSIVSANIKKSSKTVNVPKHAVSPTHPSPPSPPFPQKNLTPLQALMREKLTSARFRHLNQTLYTTPSVQSLKLFAESPSSFTSYHAGFRAQVAVWPQNPVDIFIADLKARAIIKPPPSQKQKWRDERKGKKSAPAAIGPPLDPLPRSPPSNQCTIADLGCGDATIAAALTPLAAKASLRLLSFDLATGDGPHAALITIADLCHLPLRSAEVDVAVLCLALMSTNWVEGVDEAARIVRLGGEVWVAEVRSRFARGKGPTSSKIGKTKDEDTDEAVLIDAEYDHGEASKRPKNPADDTNVDPFVAVFQRRGFALQGIPDLSNRMFVRLRFVKVRDGGKGGGYAGGNGRAERDGGVGGTGKGKRKFVEDGDADGDGGDEGKVLKPCVYKTR